VSVKSSVKGGRATEAVLHDGGGVDLTPWCFSAYFRERDSRRADAYWQNVVRATHGFFAWTTLDGSYVRWRPLRKSLRCAEHFRVMAFAQLTYRESLRTSRPVCPLKLRVYHMGFRAPIRRTTLSDANEARDCASMPTLHSAHSSARKLYASETLESNSPKQLRA